MVARGKDATHHYFLVDPFQLNAYFGRSKETYTNYLVEAERFLGEFEQKNPKPSNMIYSGQLPKFKVRYCILPLYWLYHRFNPKLNNKYSYMYYEGYKKIFSKLQFYFRYQLSRKNYNQPDYARKYVYYPLHYQPEASTIVCAQKYEKQLFYIDSWAKSLPADTMLYVKEHYAVLGHRELSFYKELRKYPNVVLIDPLVDTFSLIKNSVAVTTLTGTAGWEAMLLRKPVFLGGRIFYEDAPGVIKVNDIYENYLPLLQSWKQPSREDVIEYLARYLSTLRKGWVYAASSSVYDGDNMHYLAISLVEYLKGQGRTV
jgi:capsule polysaccharide modification protein KpsS